MQISSTIDKKRVSPSSSPQLSPENALESCVEEARQNPSCDRLRPALILGVSSSVGELKLIRRLLFRNEQVFHWNESPEEHSETLVPNKSHCQRRDEDHFSGTFD